MRSLARATARPETTLQVLAAAGLVRVGPWGETPHGGHQVNCRTRIESGLMFEESQLSVSFKKKKKIGKVKAVWLL